MKSLKISPAQINALFDVSNIKSGKSVEMLGEWGGIDCLQRLLKTNFTRGIDQNSLEHKIRINKFGSNKSFVQPTLWDILATSFITNKQIIIYTILILNILYAFLQNNTNVFIYVAQIMLTMLVYSILQLAFIFYTHSSNHLVRSKSNKVKIIRRGVWQEINNCQLLAGDILKIAAGQSVNINGVLINNNQLQIYHHLNIYDNLSENNIFIVSGSTVIKGQGVLVVCKVQTTQDKLDSEGKTASQLILNKVFSKIERIGSFIAIISFALSILSHYNHHSIQINLKVILDAITVAFTIKAITFKNSLASFVSFAYIYCTNQMEKESIIPYSIQAAETQGFVDDICVNKTGLLTDNQMKVKQFFFGGKDNDFESRQQLNEQTIRMICLSICNNSTACPTFIVQNQQVQTSYIGNQLQCALLEASFQFGFDYNKFRDPKKQIKQFPFQSNRKMMATVYKDDNNTLFVLVKGAPEVLLPHCVSFINHQGLQAQLQSRNLDYLQEIVENYGSKSLYTILLAFKQVQSIPNDWQDICHSLVALSVFGIKDTLRKNTVQAVSFLATTGINLRMVTSDNKMTAISVAKEAGILSKEWIETEQDCTVMQGKQFRQFVGGIKNQGTADQTIEDIQNFKIVQKQLKVLARSTPQDKYLLIVGLKSLGRKVSITINNTEKMSLNTAAKADVVITNNKVFRNMQISRKSIMIEHSDLASIVAGVKWSRMMVLSLQKMAKFQINMIIVTLSMVFIGILVYGEPPLRLFQIIWVHFVLSFFVGIAFVVKIPSKIVSQSVSLSEVTPQLCGFVIIQAILQIIKLCFYLFKGDQLLGILPSFPSYEGHSKKHQTIFFNVFVMTQIFSSLSACQSRSSFQLRSILSNRLLIVFVLTAIVLQLLLIKIGSQSLGIVQLSFKENILCILVGVGSLFPCFSSQLFMKAVTKLCTYLVD